MFILRCAQQEHLSIVTLMYIVHITIDDAFFKLNIQCLKKKTHNSYIL